MDRQIIPIVFATDNHYVPYCGVAIVSLIQNADCNKLYKIFILHTELSNANIFRFQNLSTNFAEVKCICVNKYVENLKILEHGYLTITAAYRLLIPSIFPQYKKVIYLDSDIIVNVDIDKLFRLDIGKNILGATHAKYEEGEFTQKHVTQTLCIKEDNFFNSGVLVFNTSEYIKSNVEKRCLSLLQERTDLYFMDQCALNIVCENRVYFLPDQWNFEWNSLFFYDAKTDYRKLKKPMIIHYDGPRKPWDFCEIPFADWFWKYARLSIFYEEILQRAQTKRIKKFLETVQVIRKFEKIAIYGAGVRGNELVNKLLYLDFVNIVLWVDKDYMNKQGNALPVECIEKLYSSQFDSVIIAIENRKISGEVKKMLVENGIPKNKIIRMKRKSF